MGKVDFEHPIACITGILIRSDPYYFRRYPKTGGGFMQIAQGRPNRGGHIPSEAERKARDDFIEKYGKQKHQEYLDKIYHNQLEIPFEE